jgi:hypothetical protein
VAIAGTGGAQAANGGTTHEFVLHSAGNKAGEAWFNSGTANLSKGRNSFTLKDLFCGDGWAILVQYYYTDPQGTQHGLTALLKGDCNPIERSFSVAGALSKPVTFHWRAGKWDVNGLSSTTFEPWVTTTIS